MTNIEYVSKYNDGSEEIMVDGLHFGTIHQDDIRGRFVAVVYDSCGFFELVSQNRDELKKKIAEFV